MAPPPPAPFPASASPLVALRLALVAVLLLALDTQALPSARRAAQACAIRHRTLHRPAFLLCAGLMVKAGPTALLRAALRMPADHKPPPGMYLCSGGRILEAFEDLPKALQQKMKKFMVCGEAGKTPSGCGQRIRQVCRRDHSFSSCTS